jgi:S-methyl-5-thioribose-1-phosphate isomerase
VAAREPIPPTIEWRAGRVRLIDQRDLPVRLRHLDCRTVDELCDAISTLAVRGAPALGAAGAFGVALAAATTPRAASVRAAARRLRRTRPTAVNLAWGVDQALAGFEAGGAARALEIAQRIAADDVAQNRAMGRHGAELLDELVAGRRARVLTHCNAGHLATVGYGTALGVVRAAHERGAVEHVWVDETRPVLQGARLTAWELGRLRIPHALIVDGAAGSLMAAGRIDAVIVGADRIAANGDVANKIGTFSAAVLAHHHRIPFLVAAPLSTIDLDTPDGAAIPIETRDPDEVRRLGRSTLTPASTPAHNPAFDVTPAALVAGIITEVGVARRPYRTNLRRIVALGATK